MYLGSKSFPLQNYPATTPFPELGSPQHRRHLEFYFIFSPKACSGDDRSWFKTGAGKNAFLGTGALCQTPLLFILMLLSDAGVEGWDLGDGLGGSASPLGCKEDLRGKNWGFCGYAGSFPSLKGPKIGCHCPMAQPSSSSLCQGLRLGLGTWSLGPCPPGTLPQGAALWDQRPPRR